MKKLILAVSVVVLLLSCMNREDRAFKYYWDGHLAESYGSYGSAIEYYTKAIQLEPDDTLYLCGRGEMYSKTGELALAIADFDEVLRLAPTYLNALELRADALEQSGDLNGAFADFTEIIRLRSADPSSSRHINAYYDRAQFHARHGEFDKAIQDFMEMAQLSSADLGGDQHMQAYYSIAQIHMVQWEFDQAIQNFSTVVQYPSMFQSAAYYWRAYAYMEMGAFDKAIVDFTEAWGHKLNNRRAVKTYEFAEAYSQRGAAYVELGDFDKAIADFAEAILLNPSLAVMSEEEKRSKNWSNDYLQQKLMLERLRAQPLYIQPSGTRLDRGFGAAMNLINSRSRQKAVNDTMGAIIQVEWYHDLIDRISRKDSGVTLWPVPDFAAAYTRRGLVYFEKGDYGLAIADFEDALRIDGDNFVAWEQLETALSFDPDHPFASEIMSMAKSR